MRTSPAPSSRLAFTRLGFNVCRITTSFRNAWNNASKSSRPRGSSTAGSRRWGVDGVDGQTGVSNVSDADVCARITEINTKGHPAIDAPHSRFSRWS
jgi:hypothetical protein